MTDTTRRVTRALLSVSDKTGLVELAKALAGHGVELVSTGGTAKAHRGCRAARSTDVSERHRLSRDDGRPGQDAASEGPWRPARAPRQPGARRRDEGARHRADRPARRQPLPVRGDRRAEAPTSRDCIENIDIGGPAMIRAAAKNHDVRRRRRRCRPTMQRRARRARRQQAARRRWRCAAASPPRPIARTAAYDAAISNWFARAARGRRAAISARFGGRLSRVAALRREPAPDRRRSTARREQRPASPPRGRCRARSSPTTISTTPTRPTSCVAEFDPSARAAVAIIKHANPCGVAEGADLRRRLSQGARLRSGRRPSAASSRVNRHARRATPRDAIAEIFTEVIIAPDATDEAHRRSFATKKNLRLLLTGGLPDPRAPGLTVKTVAGGFLVQTRDNGRRRRRRPEGRDQARADRRRAARPACSPSASPST